MNTKNGFSLGRFVGTVVLSVMMVFGLLPATGMAPAYADDEINIADESAAVVVTLAQDTFEYTGSAIMPEVTSVTFDQDGSGESFTPQTLTPVTDYTVEYLNNINVNQGQPAVAINGTGAYKGRVLKNFTITPFNISSAQLGAIQPQKYTGVAITPTTSVRVTVVGNPLTLIQGTDFSYSYNNNIGIGTNTASITVTGLNNYTGIASATFSIIKGDNPNGTPTALDQNSITTLGDTSITLTEIANTLQYGYTTDGEADDAGDFTWLDAGVKEITGLSSGTTYYITVRYVGDDNYEPSAYPTPYEVTTDTTKINITDKTTIEIAAGTGTSGNYVYTSNTIEPEVTSVLYDEDGAGQGEEPVALTTDDYTVSYVNNTNARTSEEDNPPTVIITGKGTYTGTASYEFTIEKAPRTSVPVALTSDEVAEVSYDSITIDPDDEELVYAISTESNPASISDWNDIGEYEFTSLVADTTYYIFAMYPATDNYYAGDTFSEGLAVTTKKDIASAVISGLTTQTFQNKPIVQEPIVTISSTNLEKDTDYTVTITNNINAGTANVVITGIGDYSGTVSTSFTINPADISGATVSDIADQTYTGNQITPSSITATYSFDSSYPLVQGTEGQEETDFYVTYGDNINAGEGNITIHGQGNFTGTKEKTFNIVRTTGGELSSDALSISDYTSSSIIVSEISAHENGQIAEYAISESTEEPASWQDSTIFSGLTEDTTYYVFARYKANTNYNAGTSVYESQKTKKDISLAIITGIADAPYTGQAITPTPIVTYKENALTVDQDYTVSYSNNTNATEGGATVTITGIGDFDGEKIVTFYILLAAGAAPPNIESLTATTETTTTSITIPNNIEDDSDTNQEAQFGYASSVDPANNYEPIDANSAEITWLPVSEEETITITDLNPGTPYYIFARYARNDSYEAGAKSAPVTISTETGTIAYTASDYNGTYDGLPHSIGIIYNTLGVSVKYESTEGNYDLEFAPTITNVSESPKTVNFEITKYGYTAVRASKTITLSKATGHVYQDSDINLESVTDSSIGIQAITPETEQELLYGINTSSTTPDTWQASPVFTGLNADTEYYVFAKSNSSDNYNEGTPSSGKVFRTAKGEISYDGEPTTVTYDGNYYGADLYVATDGATVKFSGDGGESYELNATPEYKNAGEYDIYFKITKDNYETVYASVKVTINKKDISSSVVSGLEDKAYNTEEQTQILTLSNSFETLNSGTDYEVIYPSDITNVGTKNITIQAKVEGNYTGEITGLSYEITKAPIDPHPAIQDWTYGEEPNDPFIQNENEEDEVNPGNPGGGAYIFKYSADPDSGFTTEKPTNAGTYYINVTISETESYQGIVSAPGSFTIYKAEGAAAATPDVNYIRDNMTATTATMPIQTVGTGQTVIYGYSTTNNAGNAVWGDEGQTIFSGLTPGGKYYFFAKAAENTNYYEGIPSAHTAQVPLPASDATTGTWYDENGNVIAGNTYSVNYDGRPHFAYFEPEDGGEIEYNLNSTGWSDTVPTVTNVTVVASMVSSYYVQARVKDLANHTPISMTITINRVAGENITETPVAATITENSITLQTITLPNGQLVGYQRSTDGEDWTKNLNTSGVFTGLTAGTSYQFRAYGLPAGNYLQGGYSPVLTVSTLATAPETIQYVYNTSKSYVYDGQAHGISSYATTAGVTVLYCDTSGGTYSTDPITVTNVSDGTKKVYFKFEKSGLETVGPFSEDISVTKRTLNLSLQVSNFVYEAEPNYLVTGNVGGQEMTFYEYDYGNTTWNSFDPATNFPRAAGEHRVKVEIADNDNTSAGSAEKTYTVSKKKMNLSLEAEGYTYGDAEIGNDGWDNITLTGDKEYATKTVYWAASEEGPWNEGYPQQKNVGEYFLKVVVGDTANYTGGTVITSISVEKAIPQLSVTLEDWTYEETPNDPELSKPTYIDANDITYLYSDSENGTYTSTKPEDAGTYYVKAHIEGTDNYDEITSISDEFVIEKADGEAVTIASAVSYTSSSAQATVTEEPSNGQGVLYGVSESNDGEGITWNDTVDDNILRNLTAESIYYIYARSAENDNYKAGAISSAGPVTIVSGITYNSAGYVGVYNGNGHGISVYPTTDGTTTLYSSNGNTYSEDPVTYANVGKYTVYFKITKDNYETVYGSETVEIRKASIAGASVTGMQTKVYTGLTFENAQELTVTLNGNTLTKGDDYEVSSSSTDVGLATLTLTGKGNYTGTKNVSFTITKAVGVTPSAPILVTRTDTEITVSVPAVVSGQDIVVGIDDGEGITWNESLDFTFEELDQDTEYDIYAKALGNNNYYESEISEGTSVTTFKTIEYTLNDVTVSYDGAQHGLAPWFETEGVTVRYSENGETYDLVNTPKITNVSESPKTVYVKFSKDGYADVYTSAIITINKAEGAEVSDVEIASYTDTSITVEPQETRPNGQTVEYAIASQDEASASLLDWQDENVFDELLYGETYYLYVRSKEADNYEAGTYKSTSQTLLESIVYEASDNTVPYDGEGHGINLSVTTDEVLVEFSLDEGSTYEATDMPTISEINTSSVIYFRLSKDGFQTVEGHRTVSIITGTPFVPQVPQVYERGDTFVTFNNQVSNTSNQPVRFGYSTVEATGLEDSNITWVLEQKTGSTITINYLTAETTYYFYTKSETTPLYAGSELIGPTEVTTLKTISYGATSEEFVYDGTERTIGLTTVTPDVTVKYSVNGEEYFDAQYKPKYINAGDYNIFFRISKDGYYTVNSSRVLHIAPAPISESSFTSDDVIYTYSKEGQALANPVITYDHGYDVKTLISGTDYVIQYSDNVNAGTATATAYGTGNYTGAKVKTFEIERASLEDSNRINISGITTLVYAGGDPVTHSNLKVMDGAKELEKGKDYTVSYSNNVVAGSANISITGIGNYISSTAQMFNVIRANPPYQTSIEDWEAGTEISTPSIVWDEEATSYNEAERALADETVSYSYALNEAGPYTSEVPTAANTWYLKATTAATANYSAYSSICEFRIYGSSINDAVVSDIPDQTYTGYAIEPTEFTITVSGQVLEAGTDYTISYRNNTDAMNKDEKDAPSIVIDGIGDYAGELIIPFTIKKAPITPAVTIEDWEYGETANEPVVSGNTGGGTVAIGYDTLEDGDYSDFDPPESAGTYYVRATIGETANYEGDTAIAQFEISAIDITTATFEGVVDKTYNGFSQVQTFTVKLGDDTLNLGTDYTVSYLSNKNAGTATLKILGRGNYKGDANTTFTISSASIEEVQISGIMDTVVYTGEAITQQFLVSAFGVILVQGTDYNVAYEDNTNAGTAKITISGTTNFGGTPVIKNFTIARANATDLVSIEDWVYRESPSTPSPAGGTYTYSTARNGEYTSAVPENAGTYYLKGVLAGNENYNGGTAYVPFEIKKADATDYLNFAIEDSVYGEEFNEPTYTTLAGVELEIEYASIYHIDYSPEIPTEAGLYSVKYSAEESANYEAFEETANFKIEKAETAPVEIPVLESYDDESITVKSQGANVLFAIATENSAPADGWQEETTFSSDLQEETDYYIFAKHLKGDNYNNDGISEALTARLYSNESILYDVTNYSGTYDGQEHTGSVHPLLSGVTVTYLDADGDDEEEDDYNEETAPAYTNVGEYTVHFKLSKDEFESILGTYTVSITKADGIAVSSPIFVSREVSGTTTVTIDMPVITNGQEIEIAYNQTGETSGLEFADYQTTYSELTNDTTYYFFARSKANDNYNAGAISAPTEIKTGALKYPAAVLNISQIKLASRTTNTITLETIETDNEQDVLYGIEDLTDTGTITWQESPVFGDSLDSGTTFNFYAKAKGDDYFEEGTEVGSVAFTTIGELEEDEDYTVNDYEGEYDRRAHTISIEGDDLVISYSDDEGETYDLYDAPSFTNVGEYTVYAKIEKYGYVPVTVTGTVTIEKAEEQIQVAAPTLDEKGADYITVNSQNEVTGGEVIFGINTDDYAPGAEWNEAGDYTFEDLNAGTTYYIFAKMTQNQNYKEGLASDSAQITTVGTIDYSAYDYEGYYDGSKHGIVLDVTTPGVTVFYSTDGEGYDLSPITYSAVGTYTVYYKLEKDDFIEVTGSKTVTIGKAPVDSAVVSGYDASYVYTGQDIEPSISVSISGRTLAAGTDYDLEFVNNKNYGEASIVITGKGNYESEVTKNFTILRRAIDGTAEILGIVSKPYIGETVSQEPTIVIDGNTLEEGTDYTLSYEDAVNITDSAKVTITGIGNYRESVTETFSIVKGDLANLEIILEDWTYGDSANEPSVTNNIGEGEVTYEYATDDAFENIIEYSDLINAGTYYVKASVTETEVTEAATKTKVFHILPKDLSETVMATGQLTEVPYTGSAITFPLSVTEGGETLRPINYEVTYESNVEPGTAHFTVQGIGNYTGSKTYDFTITKAAANIAGLPVFESRTTTSIKVKEASDIEDQKVVFGIDGESEIEWNEEGDTEFTDLTSRTPYTIYSKTLESEHYFGQTDSFESTEMMTAETNAIEYDSEKTVSTYEYDGQAHSFDLGIRTTGVTVSYSSDGSDWNLPCPTQTEVGETSAFYVKLEYASESPTIIPGLKVVVVKGSVGSEIEIEDWVYGESANEPSVTENPEGVGVTYSYSESDDMGGDYNEDPATSAGTYYVKAVFAGGTNYKETTIYKEFHILKAPGQEAATPVISETYDNGFDIEEQTLADDEQEVQFGISTFSDATDEEITWFDAGVTELRDGFEVGTTYYIYAKSAGSANYQQGEVVGPATGKTLSHISYTVSGDGGVFDYNGEYRTVVVTSNTEGAVIKYSNDEGATYGLDTAPTYVDAGEYATYYQITATGYKTVTGTASLTINKVAAGTPLYNQLDKVDSQTHVMRAETPVVESTTFNTITMKEQVMENGQPVVFGYQDESSVWHWSTPGSRTLVLYTEGKNPEEWAGTKVNIFAKGTESNNFYADGNSNSTLSASSVPATTDSRNNGVGVLSYTANNTETVYDGAAHSANIVITTADATIMYSDNQGGSYEVSETPTRTDAGTTTVYYQISKTGYQTVTGTAIITITKASILLAGLSEPIEGIVYTGSEIEPEFDLLYRDMTLAVVTDYTVGYANHTVAGLATITVTGTGNYTGSRAISFTINKRSIDKTATLVGYEQVKTYTGEPLEQDIQIQLGATYLTGTDYTVTYTGNVNAGVAEMLIEGIGNYTGKIYRYFEIAKAAITPVLEISSWTYGDPAETPSLEIPELDEYPEVTYLYKTDAPDGVYGPAVPTQAGNYVVRVDIPETANTASGYAEKSFSIIKASGAETLDEIVMESRTANSITLKEVPNSEITGQAYVYGVSLNANVSGSILWLGEGERTFTKTSGDVSFVANAANGTNGAYYFFAKAASNSNYNDGNRNEVGVAYKTAADNTTIEYEPEDYEGVFDNRSHGIDLGILTTDVTVKYATDEPDDPADPAEYDITEYPNFRAAGTDATIYYYLSKPVEDGVDYSPVYGSQKVTISAKPLSEIEFEGVEDSYVWTGAAIQPAEITGEFNGDELDSEDFDISYGANTAVGDGTVTLEAVDPNYSGTKVINFSIVRKAIAPTVSISGWEYGYTAGNPAVSGNKPDAAGVAGAVTYYYDTSATGAFTSAAKPTDAGTYYVKAVVAESATYEAAETAPVSFTITPGNLANATITGIANKTYTGSAITQAVSVLHNGTAVNNAHYTVTHANNVNVGTATVTITANNPNYTGSKVVTFTISAMSIAGRAVTVPNATYTGKAITPAVTVAGVPATGYTVAYKNNINAGTATVTITGKAPAYTGTITKTFTIAKAVVSVKTWHKVAKPAGTAKVGKTLTVKVTNPGAVAGIKYTITYQWLANKKAIAKATKNKYKLTKKEKKKTLTCKVTVKAVALNANYQLSGTASKAVTSAASAKVK